jgi:hypothetical protein
MRNISSKVRKVSSALLLSIFAAGIAAIPLMQGASASSPLNWSNLNVGDIVAHGTLVGTTSQSNPICSFDTVQIATTAGLGVSRTLDLRTDSKCDLIVHAKDQTTGVTGAGPLSPSNPGYYDYVWMYGFGGTGDKLTSVNGSANYSVSGSTVTIKSPYSEVCWWHSSTGWSNDDCNINSVTWSGNPATSSGYGDFDWQMGLYEHQLTNSESISVSGGTVSLSCVYGYSGSIVSGFSDTCKLT